MKNRNPSRKIEVLRHGSRILSPKGPWNEMGGFLFVFFFMKSDAFYMYVAMQCRCFQYLWLHCVFFYLLACVFGPCYDPMRFS